MLGGVDPKLRCSLVDDPEKEWNLKMLEVTNFVVCRYLGTVAFHLNGKGDAWFDHRRRRLCDVENRAVEVRADVVCDRGWLRNETKARQEVVR
jgi:hypothetical protein